MNSGSAGSSGPPSLISRPGGNAVSQSNSRSRNVSQSAGTSNLADLLERVLDKGIVIAGDITVSLGQVELLSIKLRLVVASIDKAQEIGIDWWRSDPALSSHARQMELQNQELTARLERMEQRLQGLPAPQSAPASAPFAPPAQQRQQRQEPAGQNYPQYPASPGPAPTAPSSPPESGGRGSRGG